jgi:hypothetical protein
VCLPMASASSPVSWISTHPEGNSTLRLHRFQACAEGVCDVAYWQWISCEVRLERGVERTKRIVPPLFAVGNEPSRYLSRNNRCCGASPPLLPRISKTKLPWAHKRVLAGPALRNARPDDRLRCKPTRKVAARLNRCRQKTFYPERQLHVFDGYI